MLLYQWNDGDVFVEEERIALYNYLSNGSDQETASRVREHRQDDFMLRWVLGL